MTLPSVGVHIGTSGWSYDKDWRGIFYHGQSSMLEQYLSCFETAEINSTFYALPQPAFVRHLSTATKPDAFFTAKFPRSITHDNRLDVKGEAGAVLEKFFSLLHPLVDRIAALLVQLPPWDLAEMADLEAFLSSLSPDFRYAIEFRHKSWLQPSVMSLLEDYHVAYVIVDEPLLPPDLIVTTDFAYVRWHGHGRKPWYDYLYSEDELKQWVPRLRELENEVGLVLGYFNNHFAGNAPLNALQMLHLMGLATPAQKSKLERMLRRGNSEQMTLDEHWD
ncbi:MAG: DUF72 domain-containing protein [Candidatus Thorarchaeota archaeon]